MNRLYKSQIDFVWVSMVCMFAFPAQALCFSPLLSSPSTLPPATHPTVHLAISLYGHLTFPSSSLSAKGVWNDLVPLSLTTNARMDSLNSLHKPHPSRAQTSSPTNARGSWPLSSPLRRCLSLTPRPGHRGNHDKFRRGPLQLSVAHGSHGLGESASVGQKCALSGNEMHTSSRFDQPPPRRRGAC